MIRMNVDAGNPGQFFAACGVFEVAAHLWPGATARFDGGEFVVDADGDLTTLIRRVHGMSVEPKRTVAPKPDAIPVLTAAPQYERDSPFVLDPKGIGRLIDWWCYDPTYKTWAGNMSITSIVRRARKYLHGAPVTPAMFDVHATSDIALTYLDARTSRYASAIDKGYSPTAINETTFVCYPAVEFFGMLGLQRFRPLPFDAGTHIYSTWSVPLPLLVAPVGAVHGTEFGGTMYRCRPAGRGGDYHKAMRPA